MPTVTIKQFAIVSLLLATAFWIWAIVNVVRWGLFDLGTVSFFTVIVTSSILLYSKQDPSRKRSTAYLTVLSHAFVSLNYVLGAYVAFAIMFSPLSAIYCIVFTLYWALSAIVAWRLLGMANPPQNVALPPSPSTSE